MTEPAKDTEPDKDTSATETEPAKEISREEVAYLADLARIDLEDDELERLSGELPVILRSVARVQHIVGATDEDIPPLSHALPISNVFRVDEVRPGLTPEEALAGAPRVEQQRFAVPRILGEEA